MLEITSFTAGDSALVYHGANRYWIFDHGRNGFELFIDVMSEDLEEIIDNKSFNCSTLSSAIATIEAMENGEEV